MSPKRCGDSAHKDCTRRVLRWVLICAWGDRAFGAHGYDHSVPPHMVNYRANIQAMVDLGVSEILAINVVGGVGTDSGDLVIVDDFIDFTKARPVTFYDGSTPEGVVHVDVGEPYHPRLRSAWKQAADNLGVDVIDHGVYGAYEGPRFETRAEIRLCGLVERGHRTSSHPSRPGQLFAAPPLRWIPP